MLILNRTRLACLQAAVIFAACANAFSMVVPDWSAAVNNRFTSGYPTNQNTSMNSPPVPNTSTSFLGYGYDFSAIGWAYDRPAQSFTMISPMHFASATHYVPPASQDAGSARIVFEGTNGQTTITRYAGGDIVNIDAALGRLTKPLAPSLNVNYMPILDLGDTPVNYIGKQVLVYGPYAQIGTGTILKSSNPSNVYADPTKWNRVHDPYFVDMLYYSGVRIVSGDSGSPTLLPYNGQLTLAGVHYTSLGTTTGYPGGGDSPWVNPYTIQYANVLMAPYGFAVKVIAAPTKTWNGASGTDFSNGANWIEGVAPNREGVGFDTTAVGGSYAINVTGGTSIKGLNFRGDSGSGFTFSGGTLKIGTGGIINESSRTQTFNNTLSMYYAIETDIEYVPPVITGAQHWSANRGDIVVNGNVINNGFQLVVDGPRNTVINGVIRGTGGLGKEGSGKLNLTGANVYTGNTTITNGRLAVNNTSGSGTGTGNVTLWYGTLAGSGRIAGSVDIKESGILSPGNSDIGQIGTLTISNGLTMTTGSRLQFHLNSDTLYDQLIIAGGTVNFGSATLDIFTDLLNVTAGQIFWIVNNTGNGTIIGTFDGLADGSVLTTASGAEFTISYAGNFNTRSLTGGNDVLLLALNSVTVSTTMVPEPTTLTLLSSACFLLGRRCQRYQRK